MPTNKPFAITRKPSASEPSLDEVLDGVVADEEVGKLDEPVEVEPAKRTKSDARDPIEPKLPPLPDNLPEKTRLEMETGRKALANWPLKG